MTPLIYTVFLLGITAGVVRCVSCPMTTLERIGWLTMIVVMPIAGTLLFELARPAYAQEVRP